MKISKLTIATFTLILTIFLTSFRTPSGTNSYLTLRTFEGAPGLTSKIIIIYDDGKTEELDLNTFSSKNVISNAQKINQALNKVSAMGYELISSNGGDYLNMYTFQRR